MDAVLNITSFHRLSPEIEATRAINGKISFGRSEQCDWHLPDPEKIISSSHGYVEQQSDGYYVVDTSTNGLFVNHSVTALGKNQKHKLKHEDVIVVGDFQIQFKIGETNAAINESPKPVAPITAEPNNSSNQAVGAPTNTHTQNPLDDFMAMPNAIPASQAVPPTTSSQIPEDWDMQFGLGKQPEMPTPVAQPEQVEASVNPNPVISPAIKPSSVPVAATSSQSTPGTLSDCNKAFLSGLGVSDDLKSQLNNPQIWQEMGQSFQLLLLGLVDSLRHRAAVKSQLRLNHTMFQAQQNNPLKFSATIEDVMQNLYARKSASFLTSEQSIKEAFKDTKDHDGALMAATTGAILGMLESLSPNALKHQTEQQASMSKFVPGQIDAKCWKSYTQLYNQIKSDVEQKGAVAFSDDFIQSYDQFIHKNKH